MDTEDMSPISRSGSDERVLRLAQLLQRRQHLTEALLQSPYDLVLYLERASVHSDLSYPDLAAGDAYRALLLTDEVRDTSFEYHEQARDALKEYLNRQELPQVLQHGSLNEEESLLFSTSAPVGSGVPPVGHDDDDDDDDNNDGDDDDGDDDEEAESSRDPCYRLAVIASVRAFQILSLSLLLCGCLESAYSFCERGLAVLPLNTDLVETRGYIEQVARRRLRLAPNEQLDPKSLPARGLVRREIYPWNTFEPDRFADESLAFLNGELASAAPKCVVKVSQLPILLEGESPTDGYEIIPTCSQLGLFAKEDIAPGEMVLREYSLLTANNRLKESTCDACGSELPPLGAETRAVSCPDCDDTVFCDDFCFEQAHARYHPAICDKDVDSIAKDPEAQDVDESLYLLLLARLLAMSTHQGVHPLALREVKYIWGDFVPSQSNEVDLSPNAEAPPEWTLPFSFEYNIETPLHVLEKMDVDIYATLAENDTWVFNTAYSKFRGTASARKNTRDGRPEVAAVHPFWCLANHDCDPNVTWEWGGRMQLWARETRVVGNRPGGIRAGEEILNHYCDVNLPVQQRREWARGSLGGWCMCQRCRDEAALNERTNGS